MRCLCCYKEIGDSTSIWHKSCCKKFFGVGEIPSIDLDKESLNKLAVHNSENGFMVPGVQKKLSLRLSKARKSRLTIIDYPSGYILKPQSDEFKHLPENEFMIMLMSDFVGIVNVPFALIKTNDEFAYITKRIDRKENIKYPMEDFCQLDLRLTEDKYKGSYERCMKIIDKYSFNKVSDKVELFIRLVFSFLVGNTDMHLKNFSLISYENGKYQLSPAYDMLSTLLVMDDKDDMALTLNGKNRNLTRNDFIKFASSSGIDSKVAVRIIDRMIKQVDGIIEICNQSLLNDDYKNKFIDIISKRKQRLI